MGIIGWILSNRFKEIEKKRLDDIYNKRSIASCGPGYVTIDITNRCNLDCIACWTYSPLLKKGKPEKEWFSHELGFDTISRLVSDLRKLGTGEIRLTGGGEPFAHPDIMDIISLIKKSRFRLDITTNFTLLNKEKIKKIIGLGVDNLTISLWAASEETYIKTHPRQKPGAFKKIMENLEYLCRIKGKTKVVIANVLLQSNYHELYEMAKLASEKNADEVYFTLMDPKEETKGLLLDEKAQEKLISHAQMLIADYGSEKFGKLKIDNPDNLIRRMKNKGIRDGQYDSDIIYSVPCTIGYTFSRILANGDVAACCKSVMMPVGNVNSGRFIDIWNSRPQINFRKTGFDLRGNPGFVKQVGCLRTCDNLMQNIETAGKLLHSSQYLKRKSHSDIAWGRKRS